MAWLELREPGPNGTFGKTDQPKLSPQIRKVFLRPLVLNQDYTFEAAQTALAEGRLMRSPSVASSSRTPTCRSASPAASPCSRMI